MRSRSILTVGVLGVIIVTFVFAGAASVSNPILMLGLLGVAGCFLLSFRLSLYFCLMLTVVFLIPWSVGFRISSSIPIIFPYRVLLLISLPAAALTLAKASYIRRQRVLTDPIGRALLFFVVVTGLTTLTSIDYESSIRAWFVYLTEWVLIYHLARMAAKSGYSSAVIWTLVCISVVVGLLTILESTTDFQAERVLNTVNPNIVWEDSQPLRAGIKRVGATLGHPIALGEFFALCLPLLLALRSWLLSRRRSLTLLFFLCVVGLILTASTGPILLAGASVALWLVLTGESKGWLRVGILAIFVLGLLAVMQVLQNEIAYVLITGKLIPGGDYSDTVSGRIEINLVMFSASLSRPFLGFGLNTWNIVLPKHDISPLFGVVNPGNEAFYGQMVLETGLAGLAITLVLFATVLRTMYRVYCTSSEPTRGVMGAMLASSISLIIGMVGEGSLHFTPIAVLFWTFAGLASAVYEEPLLPFLTSTDSGQGGALVDSRFSTRQPTQPTAPVPGPFVYD